MTAFPSAAHADDEDERDNYSLYQLASNASSYFGERNSPDGGDGLHEDWDAITSSPATGGDMLAQDLKLCWKVTGDRDPVKEESALIDAFKKNHRGQRPFANQIDGMKNQPEQIAAGEMGSQS